MIRKNPFVFSNPNELKYNYIELFPKDEKGLPIIPKGFCKAISGNDKPNWYYGFFCPKGFGDCDFDCLLPSNYDDFRNVWLCDANTVCYFTGKFDKNGTPIFEHDIVKNISDYEDFKHVQEIEFEQMIVYLDREIYYLDNCEVTGNKFDYMISDNISYKKFLDTLD